MKRIFTILSLTGLLLYTGSMFGQATAGNYSFTALSGSFTPVASGTDVNTIEADDAFSAGIPIGFNFKYIGVIYDTVVASSNGWLSFNTGTTTSALTNDLDNTSGYTNRPLVAPLWDDLDGGGAPGAQASYKLTGTAPNRVFTMEWLNWEWNYGSNDSVISFQVKLYETTNVIEFVYRQQGGTINNPSASIGIAGLTGTAGNFISLTSTGSSPSTSTSTETNTLSTKPATGQVYRFTPPVLPAVDLSAIAVNTPEQDCPDSSETIEVVYVNFGTAALNLGVTNATIGVKITGMNPQNLSVVLTSGTIASGDTATVLITSSYNNAVPGTYYYVGYTMVTGDGDASNDSTGQYNWAVDAPNMMPQAMDFTGYNGSNLPGLGNNHWAEAYNYPPVVADSYWESQTGLGTTGNITARLNYYTSDYVDWIITPLTSIKDFSQVSYDVAVTDWNSKSQADTMGSDDIFYVAVTTDCGYTFDFVDSVTVADQLTTTLTNRMVDLSAYDGLDVYVGFIAYQGAIDDPEDYDFHLDNINISLPNFDLIAPAHNTQITTEGQFDQTIDFSWSSIDPSITYKWMLETTSGTALASEFTSTDTTLSLTYEYFDMILDGMSIPLSGTMNMKWTVLAYIGSDSNYAENGKFTLKFTRGILTDAFELLTPADGNTIDLFGAQAQTVSFTWEDSQVNGDSDLVYTFYLDINTGDFTNPWIMRSSDSSGINNMMTLTYDELSSMIRDSGYTIGQTFNGMWMVTTSMGDTNVTSFDVNLKRGLMDAVQTLSNNTDIKLYPNPTDGIINLELTNMGDDLINLTVYNVSGQVVFKDRLKGLSNNPRKQYDLSHLEKGLYKLNLSSQTINSTTSFTIK